MHHLVCPKCSRESVTSGKLQCSYCYSDSNTDPEMGDNFHPKQPETAVSGETDVASGSGINLALNSIPLRNKVIVFNKKVNKSNDEILKEINEPNKKPRQETCKETDRNCDLVLEASGATNCVPSDSHRSVGIHKAFRNNESRWNIGNLQGSQKDNAPVAPVKMQDPKESFEESVHTGNDTFAFPGPSGFHGNQNVPNLLGEELNFINMSEILSTSLRRNPEIFPYKSSDPKESLGESVLSVDDTFAIPGPSGLHESQNVPNLLGEELNFSNTLEIRPTFLRKNLEIFPCNICGKDIDKHIKIKTVNALYSCCVCEYETSKTSDLQIHIGIHCPKNNCIACSREYAEGDSHVGQYICKLCNKTFQCRTEFDEHLLGHDDYFRLNYQDDYFRLNCWGCCSSLSEHSVIIKGKTTYFCCMCGFYSNHKKSLQEHNKSHRPQIICKICREEYPEKEKGLHDSKYACFKCTKEFKCRTQLEDHYNDHPKHFSDCCRFCNGTQDNHAIESEGKKYFKCCFCEQPNEFNHYSKLKRHQSKHPGLCLFKCDNCGKRLVTEYKLSCHKKTCIRFDFKCKLCRARFPCNDSLNKHISEKHGQT